MSVNRKKFNGNATQYGVEISGKCPWHAAFPHRILSYRVCHECKQHSKGQEAAAHINKWQRQTIKQGLWHKAIKKRSESDTERCRIGKQIKTFLHTLASQPAILLSISPAGNERKPPESCRRSGIA